MADERNRWLDRAAAERVLQGGPAAPVADARAREAEARLRAALDLLAAPVAPAGAELPGEAAAVAAFREARAGSAASLRASASSDATAAADATADPASLSPVPVVDLGTVVPLSRFAASAGAPRRARPVRFAVAAALASVAVGGIAAAAGAGLLDRVTHDTAAPGPAVSLSADGDPAPAGRTAGPSSGPQLRPHPFRSPDGSAPAPDATDAAGGFGGSVQGAGSGAESGFGAGTGSSAGSAAAGGAGKAGKETLGGATELHDKDKEIRLKAVDLCQAYRSGHMTDDRRERLSKLAQGLSRIPHYCEALLDGPSGTKGSTLPRSSGAGSDILKAPTLRPSAPYVPPVPTPSTSPVTRPTAGAFDAL
ncbi:hypothetical protein AB0953_07895 [Streptomyces sp. NPDC046866]|uniref:hypothetical protein n=1 Tax=Streptomyces sp. NPDC046866 TaxID=3154921 RepID=UPI0034550E77